MVNLIKHLNNEPVISYHLIEFVLNLEKSFCVNNNEEFLIKSISNLIENKESIFYKFLQKFFGKVKQFLI